MDLRESLEILSGDEIKIREREREKKTFVGQIKMNFSTKIFYPQKYGGSLNKKKVESKIAILFFWRAKILGWALP